jgi:hypothetical protein
VFWFCDLYASPLSTGRTFFILCVSFSNLRHIYIVVLFWVLLNDTDWEMASTLSCSPIIAVSVGGILAACFLFISSLFSVLRLTCVRRHIPIRCFRCVRRFYITHQRECWTPGDTGAATRFTLMMEGLQTCTLLLRHLSTGQTSKCAFVAREVFLFSSAT